MNRGQYSCCITGYKPRGEHWQSLVRLVFNFGSAIGASERLTFEYGDGGCHSSAGFAHVYSEQFVLIINLPWTTPDQAAGHSEEDK